MLAKLLAAVFFLGCLSCVAQEVPYFVTYSHHLEEPGSLEVEIKSAVGKPRAGHGFAGNSVEVEYGTTGWWTSELYLDFTGTRGESTVPGGFRIENRVRPLLREHWINPVIYAEFENINGANKSVLEVVGHDGAGDFLNSTSETRKENKREVELKLILSSDAKGWNFSENLIFEKNLTNSPWEFGYALGASRPLRLRASGGRCTFCAQQVTGGLELYGGLGDRYTPGLHRTSQYAGPVAGWQLPHGPRLTFEAGFGLNDYSLPHVYRVGVAYDLGQRLHRRGDAR